MWFIDFHYSNSVIIEWLLLIWYRARYFTLIIIHFNKNLARWGIVPNLTMKEFELKFENTYSQQMSKAEFEFKEDRLNTTPASIAPLAHSNYLRKVNSGKYRCCVHSAIVFRIFFNHLINFGSKLISRLIKLLLSTKVQLHWSYLPQFRLHLTHAI